MCSSPRRPTERRVDMADRAGTWFGALVTSVLLGLAGVVVARSEWTASAGEIQIHPETVLHLALVPMPEIVAEPEPVIEPEPESVIEPETEPLIEPEPESEPEAEIESVVEPEPEPEAEIEPEAVDEPEPELEPEPPPMEEAAPVEAVQAVVEDEGASGEEERIRAEWLEELRRRIERGKFYPGSSRYSRESGRVRLRVEIDPGGRIAAVEVLENTGSGRLAEGARSIVRRAAERPLGEGGMDRGFVVEVPITYRLETR